MFCPECGYDYTSGFSECPQCQIPLVEESAEEKDDVADLELATVIKTGDAGTIAVAKSLLEGNDIPFVVKGEVQIGLLGVGLPPGLPVEIRVRKEDGEEARELLSQLSNSASKPLD